MEGVSKRYDGCRERVLHHAICGLVRVIPEPGLSPSAELLDIFGVANSKYQHSIYALKLRGLFLVEGAGDLAGEKVLLSSAMLGFQDGLWLPIGS